MVSTAVWWLQHHYSCANQWLPCLNISKLDDVKDNTVPPLCTCTNHYPWPLQTQPSISNLVLHTKTHWTIRSVDKTRPVTYHLTLAQSTHQATPHLPPMIPAHKHNNKHVMLPTRPTELAATLPLKCTSSSTYTNQPNVTLNWMHTNVDCLHMLSLTMHWDIPTSIYTTTVAPNANNPCPMTSFWLQIETKWNWQSLPMVDELLADGKASSICTSPAPAMPWKHDNWLYKNTGSQQHSHDCTYNYQQQL